MRVTESDEPTTPLFVTASHVPTATASDLERLANASAIQSERDEPLEEGELLTFVDLAHLAADETGRAIETPMLGALKADVDRLGMLLGYGLGTRVSFGRYASLARSLDLFFKGFLSEQLRQQYPHIYTVFAGGDDLFLIGPWFDIVRLLADLGTWFERMTNGNPNITFSAGVVFSHPKVPVRQLAAAADEALEVSKDEGRDRVTIGPVTLRWPEFHRALDFHRVIRAEGSGGTPALKSSMIYRFLQYAKMAMKSEDCRTLSDLKWRAQLSYDIKRNLPDPNRGTDELRRLHEMLLSIRTVDDAHVLYTAAMLSLYHMRRN
jgi:CRISPR-associated protein Csm1